MDEKNMDDLEAKISHTLRQNLFLTHNYIEVGHIERDRAEVYLDIRPESCNIYGIVHGGAIYTMADNAAGAAAVTDGRFYVTQTSSLHFLRNQASGRVRAIGQVRHRGKNLVLTAVDILGEDDTLIATGEFTFFCVDRKMMEDKSAKARAEAAARKSAEQKLAMQQAIQQ